VRFSERWVATVGAMCSAGIAGGRARSYAWRGGTSRRAGSGDAWGTAASRRAGCGDAWGAGTSRPARSGFFRIALVDERSAIREQQRIQHRCIDANLRVPVVLCNDVEEPHAKAHLAIVNRVLFRELFDEPPKRRRLRRCAHDDRTLRGELRAKQAPDSARTKPLPPAAHRQRPCQSHWRARQTSYLVLTSTHSPSVRSRSRPLHWRRGQSLEF